jgi:hypothetical protein
MYVELFKKMRDHDSSQNILFYELACKVTFYVLAESNKEISVRLGLMWKNLSADTKESYYTASRQADEEHKRKYPGYYYSPKEARINKMQKHNFALARKGNKPVDAMHLVKVSLCCYC